MNKMKKTNHIPIKSCREEVAGRGSKEPHFYLSLNEVQK